MRGSVAAGLARDASVGVIVMRWRAPLARGSALTDAALFIHQSTTSLIA